MNRTEICEQDFNADIAEVFNIVTANVYQNHEVFLRELISNASDACEKIYIEAMHNQEKAGIVNRADLKIKIIISPKDSTIRIIDNGIGMNQEDLINNIGTIASSGTKKFSAALKDTPKDTSLIGQFGIGFYSAFLVANKVQVFSKHSEDLAYLWESSAASSFTVTSATIAAY